MLLLAANAFAGCAGPMPAASPSGHTFAIPTNAGEWVATVDEAAGGDRATVRLHGSREPLADGSLATMPVLSLSFEEGERAGGYGAYHLSGAPVSGARGSASWETTGFAGASTYEADFVTFRPNPFLDGKLSWLHLGVGLWGRNIELGGNVTIPVTGSDGAPGNATMTLMSVTDGCARVTLDVESKVRATLIVCNDPLPQRVDLEAPVAGVMTITTAGTGGALPPPVLPPTPREAMEIARAPADASPLPLTIEEALAALDAHPAAGAWLRAHPLAVAVQGDFEARECAGALGQACAGEGSPDLHAWSLNWTAPGGEWMASEVARAESTPDAPAFVTRADTGAGRDDLASAAGAVALNDAYELWTSFHPSGFELRAVSYDLTLQEPAWVFIADHAPRPLSGLTGWVTSSFDVDSTTGLTLDGWTTMLGEPGMATK